MSTGPDTLTEKEKVHLPTHAYLPKQHPRISFINSFIYWIVIEQLSFPALWLKVLNEILPPKLRKEQTQNYSPEITYLPEHTLRKRNGHLKKEMTHRWDQF